MADAWLLLPDFALIVLGWVLCRHTALDAKIWTAAEKLVYYLLFPALLFGSILRYPLALSHALPLAGSSLAIVACGIAASYALRALPGVDAHLHASGAQTAFRFNSYVALAMTERLAGAQGLAWMALIMSVCVPVCNVAAVWPLARRGRRNYLGELVRNPLIIATLAGLLGNLLQLKLPEIAAVTVGRLGAAALPLGLMAVGAGLRTGALREAPALAAALLSIRHLLLPAVGLALVLAVPFTGGQAAVLMAFAAMPTAAAAYVLASRMGGHGGFTAGLVTASTLIGAVSLPLWLVAWRALSG